MSLLKKLAELSGDETITCTDLVQGSTVAGRNSDGDLSLRRINVGGAAGGLFNTGATYVGNPPAALTGSQTMDDSSSNYTVWPFDCTSAAYTLNLQAASAAVGKIAVVFKTDSSVNAVTIARNGSDTIDGASSLTIAEQYSCYILECNSTTTWKVIARYRAATGLLFNQTAASSAVAGGTSGATSGSGAAFDQSYTIPANTLKAGDRIRVKAQATNTSGNSSDTLTLTLLIGSTSIVATAAVDVTDGGGDVGWIEAELTIRTIGGSGTFVGSGTQGLGAPGTATAKPWFKASTTIDTTATQAITVKALWSSNNASNSCRLDMLSVERVPT